LVVCLKDRQVSTPSSYHEFMYREV
jgi:hypothetical protein